jgi:long-chain acyl-CoA synthetase
VSDRNTIVDRLLRNARTQGDKPAIHFRREGATNGFAHLTWAEYARRCRAFAGALLGQGYAPGDAVTIMGENSPEWLVADVGAMLARGVAAGIYQTSTAEQAQYIVEHCEARVWVVEDAALWRKMRAARDALPRLTRVVLIRGAEEHSNDPLVVSFEDFLAGGAAHQTQVDARLAEIQDADLATLIYTSGTTGPPKGVMLSHRNLGFTADLALQIIGQASPEDCVVSYLPLSHIAEQMFSIHVSIAAGYPIWVAGGLDRLKDTLVVARPTVFMGVPRVWEKFQAALEGRLREATGLKGAIVGWARGVGLRLMPQVVESGPPGGLDGLQYALARKLFYGKLAGQLGLDRLRVAVSGAAPIGRNTLEFFASVGIIIHEVYGQSEDSGPTTFNQPFPGRRRIGTVGQPLPGVQVKIAPDGEILVRGDNVFLGYYKQPEATAETLVDGWLHSGDVGEFDAQGFLRITDRKKDLIITAGGKNVAPQNLEKLLKAIGGIGQAVVIGDRRKYLSALLTLDPEKSAAVARERGWPLDPAALAKHAAFVAHVQAGVDRVNAELAKYESIKKFTLLPVDFTPETGELTPTQKVKRKVVGDKYAAEIEAMYADGTEG